MAYEVIKHVGDRSYRYEVVSVRDAATGKRKTKWRYLGRVGPGAQMPMRNRADATRERLIESFGALLETRRMKTLTVEAVARRAKTTHATFYRYFENVNDLLANAIKVAQASLPSLDLHVCGSLDDERAKIRALIGSVFTGAGERAGLLRAFIEKRADSRLLQSLWDAHMERLHTAWATYIRELNDAGMGRNDDPEQLSSVVVTCIQARLHDAILRGRHLTASDADLWASAVSRIILAREGS